MWEEKGFLFPFQEKGDTEHGCQSPLNNHGWGSWLGFTLEESECSKQGEESLFTVAPN